METHPTSHPITRCELEHPPTLSHKMFSALSLSFRLSPKALSYAHVRVKGSATAASLNIQQSVADVLAALSCQTTPPVLSSDIFPCQQFLPSCEVMWLSDVKALGAQQYFSEPSGPWRATWVFTSNACDWTCRRTLPCPISPTMWPEQRRPVAMSMENLAQIIAEPAIIAVLVLMAQVGDFLHQVAKSFRYGHTTLNLMLAGFVSRPLASSQSPWCLNHIMVDGLLGNAAIAAIVWFCDHALRSCT